MNKKYALLITIALIAHITNTAEQDRSIGERLWFELFKKIDGQFVIEDNEQADYVKVIIRGITNLEQIVTRDSEQAYKVKVICNIPQSWSVEKKSGDRSVYKIESAGVELVYEKLTRLLVVNIFEEGKVARDLDDWDESYNIEGASLRLRRDIDLDQGKIYYNKENRELLVTIPRMVEQNKGIDGDGE